MNRRDFLKHSANAGTLLAFSSLVPSFLTRSAVAAGSVRNGKPTALVVVQLSGGNDGLNTVIPFEDDQYHRQRPTLRVTPNQVLKIEPRLGLHPEMIAMQRLYRDGLVSIAQGVGCPNSNRNHEIAMRDWHTAKPRDAVSQTGWLGRAVDQSYQPLTADLPGVFVGQIRPPLGIQAEQAVVPSIRGGTSWEKNTELAWLKKTTSEDADLANATAAASSADLLEFVRQASAVSVRATRRLEHAAHSSGLAGPGTYPQYRLAQTLRTVAQLVRAELGIRIYYVELGGGNIGGFDTHAGQAANHGALLRELAESVAAFMHDLKQDQLADRVLLMTFSEFGRTLSENGRRGTGHGSAAPMLLVSGGVQGGIIGAHPSLTNLEEDAPKFHTDFRRVYATVLDRWLGLDSQPILGGSFAPIDLVV
ncbi:MAG: DUF1501 domain-containing protein [Verrucomicrobiota bacterium]